jgi:hypothetical protein
MSEPEFWLTLLAFAAFACIAMIAAMTWMLHTMMGHGMPGPPPYIPPYIPPPPPEPPKGDAP